MINNNRINLDFNSNLINFEKNVKKPVKKTNMLKVKIRQLQIGVNTKKFNNDE